MKLKSVISSALAMTGLIYGGSYATESLIAHAFTDGNKEAAIITHVTPALNMIEYFKTSTGSSCTLKAFNIPKSIASEGYDLDFADYGCDGTVDVIVNGENRTNRLYGNQKIFSEADQEYKALASRYNLDEKANAYFKTTEREAISDLDSKISDWRVFLFYRAYMPQ